MCSLLCLCGIMGITMVKNICGFRRSIRWSLIINSLRLKRRKPQKFTCFFAKNRRFNDFFHCLPPNRGKRGKNSPFGPRQTPSAKIRHVGVYFAKTGCKIEHGFTDIFGFRVRYFVLDWNGRLGLTFTTGLLIKALQPKEKMAVAISPWRSHLFSSLNLTLL